MTIRLNRGIKGPLWTFWIHPMWNQKKLVFVISLLSFIIATPWQQKFSSSIEGVMSSSSGIIGCSNFQLNPNTECQERGRWVLLSSSLVQTCCWPKVNFKQMKQSRIARYNVAKHRERQGNWRRWETAQPTYELQCVFFTLGPCEDYTDKI